MRRLLLLTIALSIVAMLGFEALAAPPAPAANQGGQAQALGQRPPPHRPRRAVVLILAVLLILSGLALGVVE